jgi:hypothetical protein
MSPVWNPIYLVFGTLFGLPLLVMGIVLLKRGRWPRREGSDPYCRKCDYLLIGLASTCCPECGAELGVLPDPHPKPGPQGRDRSRTIVFGARTRRPSLAWTGLAMILLALLSLSPVLLRITELVDWYRIEPAWLLIRQCRTTGNTTYARLSLHELFRREQLGTLSRDSARALADVALKAQASAGTPPYADELVSFAQRQFLAGVLSDAQKDQLLRQAAQASMQVRPQVALGDSAVFRVNHSSRVTSPWWVHFNFGGVKVDGKQVSGPESAGGASSGLGGGGSSGQSVPPSPAGLHKLQVTQHIEIYSASFGDRSPQTLLHQEDRTFTGSFEVLEQPPADFLKLIDDPALGEQIKATMTPVKLEYNPVSKRIGGTMEVRNLPTNVAFNVVARINGREQNMHNITGNTGQSTDYYLTTDEQKSPPPATIDLILRADEKAARQTIDQREIWNGQIEFKDVPVKVSNEK